MKKQSTRPQCKLRLIPSMLLLAAPAFAIAADGADVGAPADGSQATPQQVRVSASLIPLGVADSANQGTVTAKQLENRPLLRTGELLEAVPGLIVTQHAGDGKANQYFARGFNLDHGTDLSTSIDGVPNNLRTHGHGQGYNDLNGLIPELVDSIEYRKGPYYAEDGDFSSAGAVRIRYKDRLDQDFFALSGGEHGHARSLVAASGDVLGGGWLGAVDLGTYDGPWQKPEDARKASLLLRYRRGDAERGLRVSLTAYDSRWDATDQIPRRAVAQGLVDRLGQPAFAKNSCHMPVCAISADGISTVC